MTQPGTSGGANMEQVLDQLQVLEKRVSEIETRLSALSLHKGTPADAGAHIPPTLVPDEDQMVMDEIAIESRIGEYGLAWLGSIVLLAGIAFLVAFISEQGYRAAGAGIGYALAAGVFILGRILRRSFPFMVFLLNICGHLLIYYITLRLFFFSELPPLLPSRWAVLVLLLAATGVQLFFALRQGSELLTGISMILFILTAIVGDRVDFSLPVLALVSITAAWFFTRQKWWRLSVVLLILVYIAYLFWLSGNPIPGNVIGLVKTHPFHTIYLFITGAAFALTALVDRKKSQPRPGTNAVILLNGIFFSIVIMIITLIYFEDRYVPLFGMISVICMAYSVALKMLTRSPFTPSFFACFGFMALSVCVYGYARLPETWFFLALQSFLVVSMALWFRSRIIVVMNSLLFLGILLMYLLFAHPVDRISFCFAFVAFGTARILNWKRERLTLKTDLMRNMYLGVLFFTLLYAFYHAMPERYITLSWTGVAVVYFILSIILRNIKYRWMAIATLLVTVIYLFVVDLSHLSVGYRVLAFLFLAIISITASLLYTKYLRKKRVSQSDE
jgi:hypothetical protein